MSDKKTFELNIFPWTKGEEPYYVTEAGEWYLDEATTRYAKQDRYGIDGKKTPGLKEVAVFYFKKGEYITRLLINNKQQIIFESQSMETMGSQIDLYKAFPETMIPMGMEKPKQEKRNIKKK